MEVQGKDMGDREMQEYIANINKQEMAKNELETKKQQVAQLEAEDLELEREKILEANFKWRQSQMLMEFACKQLAIAVTKWQSIPQLPEDALEQRYAVASEARNNLTAAAQNIQGAHRYLDNITFPYCTPDEVETLQRATMYVYTDMQNLERHEHAEKCYVTTHKRAAALLQWFDQVLTTSILKDLADVNEKVKDKTLALRRERVRLIKDKGREGRGEEKRLLMKITGMSRIFKAGIRNDEKENPQMEKTWGRSVDISLDADSVAFGASMDAEMAALEARLNAGEVVRVDSAMPDDEWRKQVMSPGELAPVPTREELFGRIDELTKQHREEAEALKREQEQIQQRVNAELQEKLNARRQRRARRSVEEKERAAYA
ncbi:unnamed protein product [Darwinula stevensoni]|uniref:Uncharacterized protein n=1 Tax=Darwinula stevensoni TaxID=69355 RepID=A0A7R9FTD1_9CRUS|nr:unnamed protein product [Darwinula stevensoni]CAG0905761.1 unnamed protein product [Darwinula stevensoni]